MKTNENYIAFKICGYLGHELHKLDREKQTLKPVLSIKGDKASFLEMNFNNLFYKANELTNEEYEKWTTEFISKSELLALETPKPLTVRCSDGVNVLVTNETRIVPCHELPKLLCSKFFIKEIEEGFYTLEEIHTYNGHPNDFTNGTSSYGKNAYYLESCLDLKDQIVFRDSIISFGDVIALKKIEESFSKKL